LRALGNEERLLIVLWLAGGTRSVRELEQATGLSQSLVSYHLRELRQAALVTASAHGRSNRYRLEKARSRPGCVPDRAAGRERLGLGPRAEI
jgi:DNA-binding transcriptional ArsR family regulator